VSRTEKSGLSARIFFSSGKFDVTEKSGKVMTIFIKIEEKREAISNGR